MVWEKCHVVPFLLYHTEKIHPFCVILECLRLHPSTTYYNPAQSLAQDTLSTFHNGFAAAVLTGLENALKAEMPMGKGM
jgi:hypothetical protein